MTKDLMNIQYTSEALTRLASINAIFAELDALPDDFMVCNLDRQAVVRAKRELILTKELLQKMDFKDTNSVIQPVTDLDQEDITYVRAIQNSLIESKYYVDQASDKLLLLREDEGIAIGERISKVYKELEDIETTILVTYPQVDEDFDQSNIEDTHEYNNECVLNDCSDCDGKGYVNEWIGVESAIHVCPGEGVVKSNVSSISQDTSGRA